MAERGTAAGACRLQLTRSASEARHAFVACATVAMLVVTPCSTEPDCGRHQQCADTGTGMLMAADAQRIRESSARSSSTVQKGTELACQQQRQ